MRLSQLFTATALATALGLSASAAWAQVKVGVVYSATGPVSMVGIPQRNTVPLLPKKVGDLTIEYIGLDDASDPTQSVTAVRKLIDSEGVDALIGPSGSPNAMGVIQFAAESGTPLLAPVGTAAVVLPMDEKKKWVFKTTQNDEIIGAALVEHMAKTGVKTLGFIGTADPFGENWDRVMHELAAAKGIKIVANERFSRSDVAVMGQTMKLMGAKPDAVIVAAPGGPSALPHTTLVEKGYKGVMYQTHGAALAGFLKLGGKRVEDTVMAASMMLVLPEIPDSNPVKKVATQYMADYEKMYGEPPATFGANVFDAGLLLQAAIPEAAKAGKPGTPAFRAALRDALEQTKELIGAQGVYNMTPEDHSGFDERGRELITVKDGQFRLVK